MQLPARRSFVASLALTTVLVTSLSHAAPAVYSPNAFQVTVAQLEEARQNINSVLTTKALVFNKLENMSIQGRVSGSINGQMVQHSPLSMLAFGLIAGGLAGAAIAAPFTIPFLSVSGAAATGIGAGAVGGAAIGGIAAPFVPAGSGQINGAINGTLDGKGYQILNTASVFGLVTLDRAVLNGLHLTVQANPNINFEGCASTVMTMLSKVASDEKTLNEVEVAEFMNNVKVYNRGINTLRSMKASVTLNQAVATQIEQNASYFENWIRELKVTMISVAGFKPVYDIQKKTYVRDTAYDSKIYAKNLSGASGWIATASGRTQDELRFWIKRPGYTEADMQREFGNAANDKNVTLESVNKVTAVVPRYTNQKIERFEDSDIRYGEIIPARDSEKELSCAGNTTEEAIDFLLRASRSYEFYLTHPGSPNFRARYN